MLHQDLPTLESTPLDGWGRWLVPALIFGAALSAAIVLLLVSETLAAAAVVAVGGVAAGLAARRPAAAREPAEPLALGPDFSLIGSALSLTAEPVALTSGEGSLLIANSAYRERFGGSTPPLQLGADDDASHALAMARTMAWRDGGGCVAGVATNAGPSPVEVERVGARGDLLLWRFPAPRAPDRLTAVARRMDGLAGERFAAAGVLAAVVDGKGQVLAANRLFRQRALASDQEVRGSNLSELVEPLEGHDVRLVNDGEAGRPLTAVHVSADPDD